MIHLYTGYKNKIKTILKFTAHDTTTSHGKSLERYRRVLLTGGSTLIVKIFSVTINLITVPLTLKYLGSERYGLWMTISSILSLMSFADLGLGNGLLNAISEANGKKDKSIAKKVVSSTFFMLTGIALIIFLLFLVIYKYVDWPGLFNAKNNIAKIESGPTIFVLLSIFVLNMPLGIIQRIQDGYQEGFKYQVWLILGSILSFIFLILCIQNKMGLPWLVLAFSGGQLIASLLNGLLLFFKTRKYLKPSWKEFNYKSGLSLMNSGLIFFFLGLFTLLGNSSDSIIISHTLNPSSVAGYEIVKKIFLFSMFTQFLIQPLWPAFGEALESGDFIWAKNTLFKGLKLFILLNAIISLPLLLFGKQIIFHWVGKEYIPSWSLLLGFYLFVIFANYGGVMSTFLNSKQLINRQLFMIALASICSVILKIFLSLKFGVSGIIWATVIGYLIFYVYPSYKIAVNFFNEKSVKVNK
jgi:O-antigen/teichoic acid export membrane protein